MITSTGDNARQSAADLYPDSLIGQGIFSGLVCFRLPKSLSARCHRGALAVLLLPDERCGFVAGGWAAAILWSHAKKEYVSCCVTYRCSSEAKPV